MTQPRVQRPLRWNVWCDWRRWLVYTHRWLGIAGGLLFAVWFVSGIVLMYAGMPELTESKRLQRLPVLDLSLVSVAPRAAAQCRAGRCLEVKRLRLPIVRPIAIT